MPLFDFLNRSGINPPLFLSLLAICILPNLWSICHVARHCFQTPTERTAWLGVLMFFPVIGGIFYIVYGRKRVRKL